MRTTDRPAKGRPKGAPTRPPSRGSRPGGSEAARRRRIEAEKARLLAQLTPANRAEALSYLGALRTQHAVPRQSTRPFDDLYEQTTPPGGG